MKTTKETVFEFVQEQICSTLEYRDGIETKVVAQELHMQRSNVSTLLNALVKEERLTKTNTRPVVYKLPYKKSDSTETSSFSQLIGYKESLRNAVQLAKAAILYPDNQLNMLLVSKEGCGTSYFSKLIHKFALEQEVLVKEAPYIKVDCRYYVNDLASLNKYFYGVQGDFKDSCFEKAQGGVLFIDHFDLLDVKQQNLFFYLLENRKVITEDEIHTMNCDNIILVLSVSKKDNPSISKKIPVIIEIPELKNRSLQERLEFLHFFFKQEATRSQRVVKVSLEAIQALLLYEYPYNVKEMEFSIKSACANAYVRVVNQPKFDVMVTINDFNASLKRSLLNLKLYENEINLLIGNRQFMLYNPNNSTDVSEIRKANNMYDDILEQYHELSKGGVNTESIKHVINTHIHTYFEQLDNSKNDKPDLEQLSKIVDTRIIDLVSLWLKACEKELGKNFQSSTFYGLCLHINAIYHKENTGNRMDEMTLKRIIQENSLEYSASIQFASILLQTLHLKLPSEEIAILSTFLMEENQMEQNHPVLLYIMHGIGIAKALAEVTNALTQCQNAYHYDVELTKNPEEALADIRSLIIRIDQGKGVIVIYDMGSIRTMINAINDEINIKIRYINIPITLIGIEAARKCFMEYDIDYIHHNILLAYQNMNSSQTHKNQLIITLCHTGEGGAVQLKNYIEEYSKLNMHVIALSISNKEELLKEVMELRKTYEIHAFVGTYDPKLMGLPFISIVKIFESRKEDLDKILNFEPIHMKEYDYEEIYKYLEDQFHYASISKLKMVMPNLIDEFTLYYKLNDDLRLGMFMHIACMIERILSNEKISANERKDQLISVFEEDYKQIVKMLRVLEKHFKILIDDNEIANIIMIVRRV